MKYISDNLTTKQKVDLIRKQMSYPNFLTFRRWLRWYRLANGKVVLDWR